MTENFKSNIKARNSKLLEVLDVDALYRIVRQRVQSKDAMFNLLSEESQKILLNNILIFNLTDYMLDTFSKGKTIDVADSILKSVISTEEFRQQTMYPTADDKLTFMDSYKPSQGVTDGEDVGK